MKGVAVALVDSLLTAMVRAEGDALVMHVGERPIVVSGARTVDLSNHGMNLGAMVGMLGQLLSSDAQVSLKELGAVEHELPSREADRFSVVAARSGDDIWIEIRRRRDTTAAAPVEEPVEPSPEPEAEFSDAEAADAEAVVADDLAGDADAGERASVEAPGAEAVEHTDVAIRPELVEAASIGESIDDRVESEQAAEPIEPEQVGLPDSERTESSAESDASVSSSGADAATIPIPDDQFAATAIETLQPASVPADAELEIPEEQPPPDVEAAGMDVETADGSEEARPAPESGIAAVDAKEANTDAEPATAHLTRSDLEADADRELTPEFAAIETPAPVVVEQLTENDESAPPVEAVVPAPVVEASEDVRSATQSAPVSVLASFTASVHPVSNRASGLPMDAARHQGQSAGGPPPEGTVPVPPSDATASSAPIENGARLPDTPVTRTVRIEVPARAASSRAAGIDRLLRSADGVGASELFLVSQARPYVRVGGNVRPLQDEPLLLGSDIEALIADVTPEPWRDAVRRGDPAEWLIELAEVGRVRCATFRDHRGPGANFHFSFLRAATADDLQLSAETRLLASEPDGLVLVSGAAGSDMSAIVAAFVDLLNQQRADYIITLEPQVRVLHVNREALVSQREVGTDPARFAASARAALREQPDVLVIESLTSGDIAQLAIDAAAQHRLVIASIEAPSATTAVQRLIELVPIERRQHARDQLSRCFRGAVAQLLLRKATGGKIAARELLTRTRAVAKLLVDGDLPRLADQLETGAAAGLAPLADTMVAYVRSGLVDVREAVRKAPDADRLVDRLRAAGADLSALDGWN